VATRRPDWIANKAQRLAKIQEARAALEAIRDGPAFSDCSISSAKDGTWTHAQLCSGTLPLTDNPTVETEDGKGFKSCARGGRLRQNPRLSTSARRFEPPFARSKQDSPQENRIAGHCKTRASVAID
jgi:hypothetical protein